MTNVERRFDSATGRWQFTATDRIAITPLREEAPGVWVARDADGLATECLVADDALATLAPGLRETLEREIGLPVGGLELMPRTPTQVATGAGAVDPLPATHVLHEPGIPYTDDKGNVVVPTDVGTVRVASSDSVLMIDVPVRASHEWVRVSDAATGNMLALGRVKPFGEGYGANITFALDDGDIHITLTDTPLDPVADRRSRRVQWLDGVLHTLRREWWRRPRRSRAAARDAVAVASALGDGTRMRAARRYARLAPLSLGVYSFGVLAGGTFVGGVLTRTDPVLAVTGSSTAVYAFNQNESVTVSVDVGTDGSLDLVMNDRVLGTHGFGRDSSAPSTPPDSDAYREVCRESKNVWVGSEKIRTVSTTYALSLRSGDRDPVLLGSVTMTSEAKQMSSIDEECNTAQVGADGSFTPEVVYERATEEFPLPSPGNAVDSSSSWTLSVERVSGGSTPETGASDVPVRFRVDG